MKKGDLKNLLKPIVAECIKEALLEGGILSSVISECMKGIAVHSPSMIHENGHNNQSIQDNTQYQTQDSPRETVSENHSNSQRISLARQELQETRNRMMEAAGLGDIFSSTVNDIPQEILSESNSSQDNEAALVSSSPALKGISANDSGVDLSGILQIAGGKNMWKTFHDGMKKK